MGTEAVAVWLGVRPGALKLVTPNSDGAWKGSILLIEHVGAESLVTVTLSDVRTANDDDDKPGANVILSVPGYTDHVLGQTVGVKCNMREFSLFDRRSGERIGGNAEHP